MPRDSRLSVVAKAGVLLLAVSQVKHVHFFLALLHEFLYYPSRNPLSPSSTKALYYRGVYHIDERNACK